MASVTLTKVWMNPVSDLSAGMAFASQGIVYDPVVNASTRSYAAGNYRLITAPGKQRFAKVTINFATNAQQQQIEDWQSVLLCYRDPRGKKFYGTYFDPEMAPAFVNNLWVITLTVQEVTFSELAV